MADEAQGTPTEVAAPAQETPIDPPQGNGQPPADAGAVTPAEPPTVPSPVNQPETTDTAAKEQASKEPMPVKPRKSELVCRYTYGVYAKSNERASAFSIVFLSKTSDVMKTAQLVLKENVDNVDAYVLRLVLIELVSVAK